MTKKPILWALIISTLGICFPASANETWTEDKSSGCSVLFDDGYDDNLNLKKWMLYKGGCKNKRAEGSGVAEFYNESHPERFVAQIRGNFKSGVLDGPGQIRFPAAGCTIAYIGTGKFQHSYFVEGELIATECHAKSYGNKDCINGQSSDFDPYCIRKANVKFTTGKQKNSMSFVSGKAIFFNNKTYSGDFDVYGRVPENFPPLRALIEKERRQNQDANASSSRSGSFHFHAGSPKHDMSATHWTANCDEGGTGGVFVRDDMPNIYNWNSFDIAGSKGGAQADIGIDAAMRKACRGE